MRKTTETETTAGNIPHLPHPAGFLMPVRVVKSDHPTLMAPETAQNGALVYALPGGGRVVAAPVYGVA